MAVKWLFLDLNSFFASCEQQENPALRGKPVIVVPANIDSTCAIAASREAKKFGIRTGTSVYDAKRLCPGLHIVEARHKLYVQYHHRIMEAVESCVPIEKICSIDEFSCRLTGLEEDPARAVKLAHKIKAALREKAGAVMTCSIGLSTNAFLAKLASDMQKPDGLITLLPAELPGKIAHLDLQDICGISYNMRARLEKSGIMTIEKLYAASLDELRKVWGGIEGERFYKSLRGEEVERPETQMRSMSHQHVLEPVFRNREGARRFLRYLLMKAAQRLRKAELHCRYLSVQVKWQKPHGYWAADCKFDETQDSRALLRHFEMLWKDAPRLPPLRVAAVLSGFSPAAKAQLSLFEAAEQRLQNALLLKALDSINVKYGSGTIGFGELKPDFRHFNGRIAFQRVPDLDEF